MTHTMDSGGLGGNWLGLFPSAEADRNGEDDEEEDKTGHPTRHGVHLVLRQASDVPDGYRAVQSIPGNVIRIGRRARRARGRRGRRRSLVDVDRDDVADPAGKARRVDGHHGVVEELIGPRDGHARPLDAPDGQRSGAEARVDQNGQRIIQCPSVRIATDLVGAGRSPVVVGAGRRPAQFRLKGGVASPLHSEICDPSRRVNVLRGFRASDGHETWAGNDPPEGLDGLRVLVRDGAPAAGRRGRKARPPDWN